MVGERTTRLLLGIACLVACGHARAQDSGLAGLFRDPGGVARRVSSAAERDDETFDGEVIGPGVEIRLAGLTGTGVITHLWMTADCRAPGWPRSLVLRAYWDAESTPSVVAPIGDFFGVGHGLERTVKSEPVRVGGDGRAFTCYWPMPFNDSAVITLRNESDEPVRQFSYVIDWLEHRARFGEDLRTFHARYNQVAPGDDSDQCELAEIEGRGHYVGSVLSIYSSEPGWAAEGDDKLTVDGVLLRGTGTEDYFGDAWDFREDQGPYSGVTVHEGSGAAARTSAYRWHVRDPIPFQRSLTLAFERIGWAQREGRWKLVPRPQDHFSGVAFWYQSEPHVPFPALAPLRERFPYAELRWEGEDWVRHAVAPKGAPRPITQTGRLWSRGGQLAFEPTRREHAQLQLAFEVDSAAEYDLFVRLTESPDAATWDIYLDGAFLAGPFELASDRLLTREVNLGRRELDSGKHILEFRAVEAASGGRGWLLGLDALMVRW